MNEEGIKIMAEINRERLRRVIENMEKENLSQILVSSGTSVFT